MPKFAANLTTMFTEYEFLDRFAQAKACGFDAIEVLYPYDHSPEALSELLAQHQLKLILINTAPGNQIGDVGIASNGDRKTDFRRIFDQAQTYAGQLDVPMIHVMAGRGSEAVFVENIQWAADQCPDILLNLEPLNARDVPDYLHSNSGETVRLIEKIDRPNVRLQYDFYHMQIMEGDLAANVMARMEHISHIQFSSVPGRHEPQFGEVNIPYLIELLDEVGYEGWIGCEYKAKTDTKSGLSWGLPYGLGKEM